MSNQELIQHLSTLEDNIIARIEGKYVTKEEFDHKYDFICTSLDSINKSVSDIRADQLLHYYRINTLESRMDNLEIRFDNLEHRFDDMKKDLTFIIKKLS